MASPTLGKTFKKTLLNPTSLIAIVLFSFFYYSFSVLIINYRLLASVIFSRDAIFFKFNLLFQLLVGGYSALGLRDFIFLVISSILVGANVLMLFKTIKNLRNADGKLTLTVGGTTVLGFVAAGTCSCGFSILALLGLAGALSFLPFKGFEVQLLVIALLAFSFFYSLRSYHQNIVCKIP